MLRKLYLILALSIGFAALHASARRPGKDESCHEAGMTFEEYIRKHKRSYAVGSEEYRERQTLFEQRSAEVRSHNCMTTGRSWRAGVNFLSDRTAAELATLRGRKGNWGAPGHPTSGGGYSARQRLATLESKAASVGKFIDERGEATKGFIRPAVPASFSWDHLQAMHDVVDQGACGSCWASATVKMLEAHSEIYSTPTKFSLQQLVSCAPNPEECGGNGGCNGSTGELALDYVMHNGLSKDSQFKYLGIDTMCPQHMMAVNAFPIPQPTGSSFLARQTKVEERQDRSLTSPAHKFGMIGWSRLPVNQLGPLYTALYQEGPIAVSVVAGDAWNLYWDGIMDNCTDKDMVVNHLVVLIGYGEDSSMSLLEEGKTQKYWQIQNSWGKEWGERGHIRLIRRDDSDEQELCAMNDHPEVGTGCKGGPSRVWVCGSCGVLYDNVVPHFHGTTPRAVEMIKRREENRM